MSPLESLFCILLICNAAEEAISNEEPVLHELLFGFDNCDVQIIYKIKKATSSKSITHFHALPTIANISWAPSSLNNHDMRLSDLENKIKLDPFQSRTPFCRVIYIFINQQLPKAEPHYWWANRIVTLVKHSCPGQIERKDWISQYSSKNLFALMFSINVGMSTDLANLIYGTVFFFGRISASTQNTGKMWIWIPRLSFPPSEKIIENCFPVGEESVVQVLQREGNPPIDWGTLPADTKDSLNPFDHLSSQSINIYLMFTVLKQGNVSYFLRPTSFGGLIFLGNIKDVPNDIATFVVTGRSGYSFLSCCSKSQITFEFYITPFEPSLWIGLLVTFVILVIILQSWVIYTKVRGFPCWLFVLGALLEDGIPPPNKIEGKPTYRLIFGCWIIAAVFLTNCYNGLMVTGLNSPLATNTLDTFADWVCGFEQANLSVQEYFRVRNWATQYNYSIDLDYISNYFNRLERVFGKGQNLTVNPTSLQHCGSLLSFPVEDTTSKSVLNDGRPAFVGYLFNKFRSILLGSWNKTLKPDEFWLNLFHPKHRHFPRNTTNLGKLSFQESANRVEMEVVECGKTAFIAESLVLESEFEYLTRKYARKKFYKSKDVLDLSLSGVVIMLLQGCYKLSVYYRNLVETGIYERLMVEQRSREWYKRKFGGLVAPQTFSDKMTMDGCIVTLFILCASLAGTGSCICICECRKVLLGSVGLIFKRWCSTMFRLDKKARFRNTVQPFYYRN